MTGRPQQPDTRGNNNRTITPTLNLNNGVEMPAVGLGVFQTPPDDARDAVRAALGGGVPAESTELVAAG
jgi:hypothetical protein